ncbi:hypothetical protein BGZ60DRAFT_528209 [Tricladium varicosporioides]|nr:hypothetical protein BGZ60DRAFT_528209 [Hymenoscyphus varicosporioides]
MALDRLQSALGMVTNDVTVAAGKCNFDFTLAKNEVPKEYRLLGESLSRRRKDEGEGGKLHITARRLGALFDGVCSLTPALVRAYGTRVSEISQIIKEKSPTGAERSIFGQYLGADGTSIWAAATSSTAAIQVQLLACMLARLFDAPESISVWVEIVKDRRKEIATRFDNNEELHFSTLSAAAQAEITRDQLAEWDTSARAWLRTADAVKMKEQKQLGLILDNLGLAVNEDVRVFSSVIAVWKASLITMDNLVSGIPQAVENGAAILGLASWHIYPDMVVLGSQKSNLRMNDPTVMPGGVLTVGLQSSHTGDKGRRGIYWSLSLAHLRYYGLPVLKERELNSDTSRVGFDQFSHAVFGCLLGCWDVPQSGIPLAIELFISMEDSLRRGLVDSPNHSDDISMPLNEPHWFQMFAQTARQFHKAEKSGKDQILKLIKLGQRRSGSFLPSQQPQTLSDTRAANIYGAPSKFLGLQHPPDFIRALKTDEDRIAYLRKIALRLPGVASSDLLIRSRWQQTYSFMTAVPDRNPFTKGHTRWYPHASEHERVKAPKKTIRFKAPVQRVQTHSRKGSENKIPNSPIFPRNSRFSIVSDTSESEDDVSPSQFPQDGGLPQIEGEICQESAPGEISHDSQFFIRYNPHGRNYRYDFLMGDPALSALFIMRDAELSEVDLDEVPLSDILEALQKDSLSLDRSRPSLVTMIDESTTTPMRMLCEAKMIYMELPEATVDIGVLDQPLMETKWVKHIILSQEALGCGRAAALSCIAMFDTGRSDVDPDSLHDSFAMASGDSIYISEQLLCDPWEIMDGYKFKRVLGNIGRTGVTMLIPPASPMIRPIDPGSWKVINNGTFNSQEEDHFTRTTLHLSFTEYYRPLDFTLRGEQDIRVGLLESIISVHDAGRWVADVDILAAMSSLKLGRISGGHESCLTDNPHAHKNEIISLENWDEVLDIPRGTSVIRAWGNPLGRLALASVLIQLYNNDGARTIGLCPPKDRMCIFCLSKAEKLKDGILIY